MTYLVLVPAAVTTILDFIMMVPNMRRRAADRGLSGSVQVPATITVFGLILMAISILL